MRKQLYISLLAALLALPLLTKAQDAAVDSIGAPENLSIYGEEEEEGGASDSIEAASADSLPTWYVAPEIPESLRAPQRAAASGCMTDSILTFNVDSILTEATTYDYDAAGRTIRTTVWTYTSDGSRIGKSKQEYAYDPSGSQIYTGTFAWDTNAQDWKGTAKSEFVYNEAHKMESNISYTWVNNTWLPQTAYTYEWDASGRQTEYTTYTRNVSVNHLVPSKQLINVWYGTSTSKKTQEINYTAYSNGAWSAGTRKDYQYDGNGNQIEYIYYSSLSNGSWVGSTRELWTYSASNKKTNYEKYTWTNGIWKGSSKEMWEFNTSGKQTLHEKFTWSNDNWSISLREISGYDAAGNNILVENYSFTNGVQKGTKKEEYTYNSAKKKTNTYKYKWVASDNAWAYNTWQVTDYDAAGNNNETASYNWINNDWVGAGTRILKTFNSSKKVTEQITQTWPTGGTFWVNMTCTTTTYSGAKTLMEAYYIWQDNDWLGTSRKDYHYNAAGLNDTTKTYTNNGTDWVYSNRTINTYNASGTNIMTHNSEWNGTAWQLVSMTRTDKVVDAAGHVLLNASWRCGSDSIWIGISKDTSAYSVTGKPSYTAVYSGWKNNDWDPYYKVEYFYDSLDRKILEQRYDWNVTFWKGNYCNEYEYDAQGNQNVSVSYIGWDNSTGSWIGSSKTEQTFDANRRVTTTIISVWSVNTWEMVFRYSYAYDNAGREIEKYVEKYENNSWVYSDKYVKEYKGSTLVMSNSYSWINNQWMFSSRYEDYYDNDAQAKLRRHVEGSWNSGSLLFFSDIQYFYSCDAPAGNGTQPRVPTEIEETYENNENNENNIQPLDPTQPTYNLSGQRVDPATYHGLVIQSGYTYYLW